jgi:hypothetical protein
MSQWKSACRATDLCRASALRRGVLAAPLPPLTGVLTNAGRLERHAGYEQGMPSRIAAELGRHARWAGHATQWGRVTLVVGSNQPLTPLAPDMQKLLQVDRLIENSSTRVFYLMKPQGDTLQYVVDQQFKRARCELHLIVPKGYSDTEVLKIVATLASPGT